MLELEKIVQELKYFEGGGLPDLDNKEIRKAHTKLLKRFESIFYCKIILLNGNNKKLFKENITMKICVAMVYHNLSLQEAQKKAIAEFTQYLNDDWSDNPKQGKVETVVVITKSKEQIKYW